MLYHTKVRASDRDVLNADTVKRHIRVRAKARGCRADSL